MTTMILGVLLIQIVIQLVAYEQVKKPIFTLNRWLSKKLRSDIVRKLLSYEMIVLNVLISIGVGAFTGSGLITGITNLFASCILGMYMMYEAKHIVLY